MKSIRKKVFDLSVAAGIVWLCIVIAALCFAITKPQKSRLLSDGDVTSQTEPPSELVPPISNGEPLLPSDAPASPTTNTPPANGTANTPSSNGATSTPVNGTANTPPANGTTAAQARDVLLMSKTDGLNVRAGRSTSYRVLGSVERGDMLAYTEEDGGWYRVLYRNGYGYVSSAYVGKYSFDKSGDVVEKVIGEGKKLLGTPYVYGAQRYHYGNGVLNGAFTTGEFDCSSLMQYIFKKGANVNLDMTSREQSVQGKAVSKSNLKRGDLMFFTNASRKNKSGIERIGHVALYLGDNHILHTASDYAVIEEISALRWSYFISARRVL